MACEIEEYPKVRVGLPRGLAGAERHHFGLTDIEVVDIEVKVRLLRLVGTRPHRRLVVGSALKCESRPTVAAELHPVATVTIDLPTGDRAIERGEGLGVGTIEREHRETGNGGHSRTISARDGAFSRVQTLRASVMTSGSVQVPGTASMWLPA